MKADEKEKLGITNMVRHMLGRPPIKAGEEEQSKVVCPISLLPPSTREFFCDIPKTRETFLKTNCRECSSGNKCIPREALRDRADEEVNKRPLYPQHKFTHSAG